MGYATLGPPNDTVTFRIDPDEVKWDFQVNTSVIDTVGGRVVQIVGATLSDITVRGHYGEDHSKPNASDLDAGRSWRLAEAFIRKVRTWMDYQAQQPDFSKRGNASGTNPPVRFTYSPFGWDFSVYIKGLVDPAASTSISHTVGKFSYEYELTLFVVEDRASDLQILRGKAAKAADNFIARISKGIGWERYDAHRDYFAEQQFSGHTLQDAQSAVDVFKQLGGTGATSQDGTGTPTGPNVYTPLQLAQLAQASGFAEGVGIGYSGHGLTWAVAVALAESGGDASEVSPMNTDGSRDHGLWQINDKAWSGTFDFTKILDPVYNAGAAYQISEHGMNWNPWSTFHNGRAQSFYAQAEQAVQQLLGGK